MWRIAKTISKTGGPKIRMFFGLKQDNDNEPQKWDLLQRFIGSQKFGSDL